MVSWSTARKAASISRQQIRAISSRPARWWHGSL